MKEILSKDIITEDLASGAIFNDAMQGFRDDYLVLHCLVKKYPIKRLFEIGTNLGRGTRILKNAIGTGTVISLDLPSELASMSLQHPETEGVGKLGQLCDLPYIQVYGDSQTFKYDNYLPLDAFFIDGEHTYTHVFAETQKAIKCEPKLIVWHDSDMPQVNNAITDSFAYQNDYDLYRVTDTRIAYAVRK